MFWFKLRFNAMVDKLHCITDKRDYSSFQGSSNNEHSLVVYIELYKLKNKQSTSYLDDTAHFLNTIFKS